MPQIFRRLPIDGAGDARVISHTWPLTLGSLGLITSAGMTNYTTDDKWYDKDVWSALWRGTFSGLGLAEKHKEMIRYAKNQVEAETWRTNSQKEEETVLQEWMARAVSQGRECEKLGE